VEHLPRGKALAIDSDPRFAFPGGKFEINRPTARTGNAAISGDRVADIHQTRSVEPDDYLQRELRARRSGTRQSTNNNAPKKYGAETELASKRPQLHSGQTLTTAIASRQANQLWMMTPINRCSI
jgi:hypothetical protein